MSIKEIITYPIQDLLDTLRKKIISVEELTNIHIKQINSVNSSLNAVIQNSFESAIKDSIEQLQNYPNSLKNIFEKNEKFTILDNDTNKIKEYILTKI